MNIVVQINGKKVCQCEFNATINEELQLKVQEIPKVKKAVNEKSIKKIIVVPNRLVNIVV